ncbi:MAG: hypothetical protein Kow00114_00940 [Kiloniellaceae bacterium]
MKKSLIAGASIIAMVAGLSGAALAEGDNTAESLNFLDSEVKNDGLVGPTYEDNDGIGGGADNSFNNDFGDNTFQDEVLNQNNINSGINSAQQGGNAAAIALDGDGPGSPSEIVESNFAKAKNFAKQKVYNDAYVNADDETPGEANEADGIAGQAVDSLNNEFGERTFENQAINQNNINSGINNIQQGGNAAAIAVDLDGSNSEFATNTALAGNHLEQKADNDAISTDVPLDAYDNDDNDAIAGEVDNSLRNDFGDHTFDNQAINQNNINSGINSAQQGANTTAIAASVGPDGIPSFNRLDLNDDTAQNIADAVGAHLEVLGIDVDDAVQVDDDVEDYEVNFAGAWTKNEQEAENNAINSGEADSEEDGGIGGDPEDSLHNSFGDYTFRDQAINQNNINSGINSVQQGGNTLALAVDTDGSSNDQDWNIAVSHTDQRQKFRNKAEADDLDNDGVGGFDADGNPEPTNSLYNDFGENTFENQVINQNNINAGINNGQQGGNTSAMAIDASTSTTDVNSAHAHTKGKQSGYNKAKDEAAQGDFDDTALGIGGNPGPNNLNNKFGDNTFRDQVINQNNINAGINSAQQGGNTVALAIADEGSRVDENTTYAKTELTQGKKQPGPDTPLLNEALADGDESGGVGGNPHGAVNNAALSNHFGDHTFQNQVLNQNNINSGINSAQQGANTVALSIDLGGASGLDENTAVALADLDQIVTNTATVLGNNTAGVGGGAVNALNNNFGSHTFQNQVMNQNNINSGINSAQQGANTVSVSFAGSGGS